MASSSPNSSKKCNYYTSVEELCEPVEAEIYGNIPKWLTGTLLRNGPGKFEVGDASYNHCFDGLALLQQFVFKNGKVTYFNKFLRSQSYIRNMKAGTIVQGELATRALPDPCKNIFARWFSYFFPSEYTDNASVNFCCINGKLYANTEVSIITEINARSLETLGRVDLTTAFHDPVKRIFSATAHPLKDNDDRFLYNLCFGYEKTIGLAYIFTKLPVHNESVSCNDFSFVSKEHDISNNDTLLMSEGKKEERKPVVDPSSNDSNTEDCSEWVGQESILGNGQIIGSIPAGRYQSYSHSFAMTKKYLIFIEQPLSINLLKLAVAPFIRCSIIDTFFWDSSKYVIFHIICRSTGEMVGKYSAKPFFFFHVVNSYDDSDGSIIIDICCYKNASILYELYLKDDNMEESVSDISQLRRYHIPAAVLSECRSSIVQSLVLMSNETDYELISDDNIDVPRINEKYHMKLYRFVYGLSRNENGAITTLVKLDLMNKISWSWCKDGCYPSEPVFIPFQGKNTKEDTGVVLSSVYDVNNENSFLLCLDAETFTELGRAVVALRVAPTIHGVFLPN